MIGRRKRAKKTVRFFLIFVAVFFIAGLAIAYTLGIVPRYDAERTLHSPIFSADGRSVYLIERRVKGLSWGPGIEFFSSPAKVLFLSDRFSLDAVDLESGSVKTLHTWTVPHEKTAWEEYRNRLFGIPGTELRVKEGRIFFKIGLDVLPDGPNSRVNEWLVGSCDLSSGRVEETKTWDRGYEVPTPWPEETLSGDREVLNFKNKEVLIYEHRTGGLRLLVAADPAAAVGRGALASLDVQQLSHRADLERLIGLRQTQQALERRFKEEGLPEGEAALRTSDEMEKLGLYPKSPKIVATLVAKPGDDYQTFAISRDEFRFGLFHDIEEAIKKPGEEIHFWGNYIRHRDFDTSERLNKYLAAGNTGFYVTTEGKTYLLKITK